MGIRASGTAAADDSRAAELRTRMVDRLRERPGLPDPDIERVLHAVPRHLFVPNTPIEDAYGDRAVFTKEDVTGPISAASAPSIVATMLEQLQVRPGHNVLEIGAGTGYNAALLGLLAGPTGTVTTVDVDEDLVNGARDHLASAGIENVRVVLGDGARGHPDNGPYDRIVVTVGTADLPADWSDQLRPAGRLVVPVRIRGSATRSITFVRSRAIWASVDSHLAVFMPLRSSSASDPRGVRELSNGAALLHAHREQQVDDPALSDVLSTPGVEVDCDVEFAKGESLDPLWVWLACALSNSLSRLEVRTDAVEAGMIRPMTGWGSMATVDGDSLAYLTMREAGVGVYRVGVIGHGRRGEALAEAVADEIGRWSSHRTHIIRFEFHPNGMRPSPGPGRFVVERPSGSLLAIWEP